MADINEITKKVIATLNLSQRDIAGIPSYTTTLGDNSYAAAEITRAVQDACNQIMRTICETPGHPDRDAFIFTVNISHGAQIPKHVGPISTPRITPFAGAPYTLVGKLKSTEEVTNYRANPGKIYSPIDHNQPYAGSYPSPLAGFYAVEDNSQTFYFTGEEAELDYADFTDADVTKLPDTYTGLAIALAITNLKKDGDVSDVFTYYAQLGLTGLQQIRAQGTNQPIIPAAPIKRRYTKRYPY